MHILNFCDLDGVFVQTARHVVGQPTTVAYTSPKGKDIVLTDKQLLLHNKLNEIGYVVPVTARSLESMNRLKSVMNFNHHKICDHGAFLYDENDELVKDYSDSLIKVVYEHQNNLKIALDKLSRLSLQNSIFDNTLFKPIYHGTYLLHIEGKAHSDFHAKTISKYLSKLSGLVVSTNGPSFSVTCGVPSYKQLACDYLLNNVEKYKGCLTLGFGDSVSDLPFITECDYSVIPNKTSTQIQIG